MNPLTFLPLLAAVAVAAPGVYYAHQPALALPLTKTIHYANTPVVTGYQSTVLKPALATAPLALQGIAFARQIPEVPTSPAPPADFPTPTGPPADLPGLSPNSSTPAPGPPADAPTPPPIGDLPIPGQPPQDNNGTGSDQPIPGVPVPGIPLLNTANVVQLVNPVALPAQPVQVAAVRAAQAGDFEPLVTKERVLAPVRTHTQITPQYTQIQPEIQVRRVIQEVPVAQPVAIQTPVFQQFATHLIA